MLSQDHYRAIGRISVAFSDVETWTNAFLWQLIGPDQLVGQMVTARMSFGRSLELFAALFRHRFKSPIDRARCEEHLGKLSALESRRNEILHATWMTQSLDQSDALRFKITTTRKKGLAHAKEVLTPAQLDAIADEFAMTLNDFSGFMIPLAATLPQPGP